MLRLARANMLPCLTLGYSDNLAVSAQGFRRGANRVRKVLATLLFIPLTSAHFSLLLP